jgi:hypothetical protein
MQAIKKQFKDENTSSQKSVTEDTTDTTTNVTRKDIKSLGNRIKATDTDEQNNLELFCYVRCNPDDNELIKNCRGIVFNKEKVVMKAFPYTIELCDDETDKIQTMVGNYFDKCKFFDSHEGTLIRMFCFNEKWYISTHRKLNAFRSKWSSKESFGETFVKCLEHQYDVNKPFRDTISDGKENILEKFQTTLDKSKQYMFLIKFCKENRVVCQVSNESIMFHVGTFVEGELSMQENINLPYCKQHSFKNIDQMVEFVKNIDYSQTQGIICFGPDNKQYKIYNTKYKELYNARGNEPSIKFRYLQVRMNRQIANIIYYLYPEKEKEFDDIENNIFEISQGIYQSYIQRFIKKRFVTVPSEEFSIIKECHRWHEDDRTNNRISIDKVINVMNKQNPTNINRMLRRLKNQKNIEIQNKSVSKIRQRSNTIGSDIKNSPLLIAYNKEKHQEYFKHDTLPPPPPPPLQIPPPQINI